MYSVILLNFRGTSFLFLNLRFVFWILWHGFFFTRIQHGQALIHHHGHILQRWLVSFETEKQSHKSHFKTEMQSHQSGAVMLHQYKKCISGLWCFLPRYEYQYVHVVMHVLRYHVLQHKMISLSLIFLTPKFPHFSHFVHSKFWWKQK